MRRLVHLCCFCFLLAGVAGAAAEEDIADLRERAEAGHSDSQFSLGFKYATGEGVPKDSAEAVKWYRKAAEQGIAGAQINLGVMYEKGEGVPKDAAEAVKWYRKAAEQGFASAQFNLRVMYFYGQGVPKDYVEAHAWFNIAAANGHERAKKARTIAEAEMTRDQLAEAQKLARERFEMYKK